LAARGSVIFREGEVVGQPLSSSLFAITSPCKAIFAEPEAAYAMEEEEEGSSLDVAATLGELRIFLGAAAPSAPPAAGAGGAAEPPAWEASGCRLWDLAALPAQAAALLDAGACRMLAAVASAALAAGRWRAAEVALGAAANLAAAVAHALRGAAAAAWARRGAELVQDEALAAVALRALCVVDADAVEGAARLAVAALALARALPAPDGPALGDGDAFTRALGARTAVGQVMGVGANTLRPRLLEQILAIATALAAAARGRTPVVNAASTLGLLTGAVESYTAALARAEGESWGETEAAAAAPGGDGGEPEPAVAAEVDEACVLLALEALGHLAAQGNNARSRRAARALRDAARAPAAVREAAADALAAAAGERAGC
jgi:SWI/SNF-related matrix-associated actin-dependent regulator 1 of chromatin subfamily A